MTDVIPDVLMHALQDVLVHVTRHVQHHVELIVQVHVPIIAIIVAISNVLMDAQQLVQLMVVLQNVVLLVRVHVAQTVI